MNQADKAEKIKSVYFTPVILDNNKNPKTSIDFITDPMEDIFDNIPGGINHYNYNKQDEQD